MDQVIIYQVEESAKPKQKKKCSICSRLCSYFNLLGLSKTQGKAPYQIEIDSPKYQTPQTKRETNRPSSRKSLVIDLDETLVHSSFKEVGSWDFTIDITVQGLSFKIFVSTRPGASEFIEKMSEYYNVILFTASLKEYADPVMDMIDINKRAVSRLFREHCVTLDNALVKDLRVLEQDLSEVIIIDNSDVSFKLQPENAIHIRDYFYDKEDRELDRLTPFLIWLAEKNDVRPVWRQKMRYETQNGSSSQRHDLNLEQQFLQYEEQHIQSQEGRSKASMKERDSDPASREELIDRTEKIQVSQKIRTKSTQGCSKTMTLQIDPNYYDPDGVPELRVAAQINSPGATVLHFNAPSGDKDEDDLDEKKSMETSEKEYAFSD